MKNQVPLLNLQRGGLMVEVLVSLLLLSVSILGLVRVLGNSLQQSGDLGVGLHASSIPCALAHRWPGLARLAGMDTAQTIRRVTEREAAQHESTR